MKKTSLSATGLSLSQAQSISNLCNQRAKHISDSLTSLNNAEKTLVIGGEKYYKQKGRKIPANVIELLHEKASLHAVQAFLMENIKAKDVMLKEIASRSFVNPLEYPIKPEYPSVEFLESVEESWGWEQLSVAEYNDYLSAESYASHIGQFIHKNGTLDILRSELSSLETLEFISLEDGKRTPLKVEVHHTSEELLAIHNELAGYHRKFEQRVNYFKAKVKNLVTMENARIAKVNADRQAECLELSKNIESQYLSDVRQYNEDTKKLKLEFEKYRQEETSRVAQLRMTVDPRFQPVLDTYLNLTD